MTNPVERAARALYESTQPPSHDTEAHTVFASIDLTKLAEVIYGADGEGFLTFDYTTDLAAAVIAYLTGETP